MQESATQTIPPANVFNSPAARFKGDTDKHEMTVLHDDGLYRHLRFKEPGTSTYYFDLVTWPGYLTISGDMGCYTFARIEDMFGFFSNSGPDYWAEKIQGSGYVQEYSERLFREHVTQAYNDHVEEDPGDTRLGNLWDEIVWAVLGGSEDEHEARAAAARFKFESFEFYDSWEWSLQDFTYRYLWCCEAIPWGIQQYRSITATPIEGAAS